MLTENQQTVYDWINDELELPVYAEAYKGAIEQLNNRSSGYITFVSHTGRDLMNGLVPASQDNKREQVQYVQLVDKFKDDWKDEWGENGFHPPSNIPKTHSIPNEICQKVKKLVDDHKEGRLRAEKIDSSFFTTFLDYENKDSIPENLSHEWRRARLWFKDHAHLLNRDFEEQEIDEVEEHFRNLDDFLYAAAATEIEQLRSIHEILEETNQ